MKNLLIAVVVLACALTADAATRIRIRTVDFETGEPVPGFGVEGCYGLPNYLSQIDCHRLTGDDGWCVIRADGASKSMSLSARKLGWFTSVTNCAYAAGEAGFSMTVRVYKADHLVPLCQGDVRLRKEDLEKGPLTRRLEFDMVKGDWLPPEGTGSVCDIAFSFQKEKTFERVGTGGAPWGKRTDRMRILDVTFPGEDNGIVDVQPVGDCLQMPVPEAPESGYSGSCQYWIRTDSVRGVVGSWSREKFQCFRIRTKTDDQGKVTSALYGKISRPFEFNFEQVPHSGLSGAYLLNLEPNTRNLRWDALRDF